MPRAVSILGLLVLAACRHPAPATPPSNPEADVAAARALFERNLAAIQAKDRDAYLACYRADDALVRAGPEGVRLGYADLASGTSSVASEWPTRLDATQVSLHPIRRGVVYGSYRYRVIIAGETTEGWSERVFVKTPEGWRIAVTTAFPTGP